MARKVAVHAWVTPEVARALQAVAERERLSISAAVESLLRTAITQGDAPTVREEVAAVAARELRRAADRLAGLLARTALAAEAARIMVGQVLARQVGADEARRLADAAWSRAVSRLRERLVQAGVTVSEETQQ
jgi:hypothetical protein